MTKAPTNAASNEINVSSIYGFPYWLKKSDPGCLNYFCS
jgi:hypothetical protein